MAQIVMNPAKSLPVLLVLLYTLLAGVGCSQPQTIVDGKMDVVISGETFSCIIVSDPESRTIGLGNHPGLARNEAMLFSFPDSEVKVQSFLMRDCTFDIDIIFLDSTGRITAMHAMVVEEPKREDESQLQYELRLQKYSSRFNAQYAIEFIGGTLERLDLSEGDQIKLDTEALQAVTS